MKKIFILFFIGTAFFYSLNAQVQKFDIYTPKGNPVVTYQMTEATATERAGWDSTYISGYPSATPIYTYPPYSSTQLFNCHGYAWLRVEGGPDRWIGLNAGNSDPDIYMTDKSYVEVPAGSHPAKIFYNRPSDHSAVTTAASSTTVISKWNKWTLMQHTLGYGPNFGSSWKYFAKAPNITGANTICSGSPQLFSASNWYTGHYWTCSSNLNLSSTTTSSTTVSANGSGAGWVSIKNFNGVEIAKVNVWVGPINLTSTSVTGPFDTPTNFYTQFYVTEPQGSSPTGYQWTVNPNVTTKIIGANSSVVSIIFDNPGYYTVHCKLSNACGWGSDYYAPVYVYNHKSYTIPYPNPAIDVLNLSFDPDMVADTRASLQTSGSAQKSFLLSIKLLDNFGSIRCQITSQGEKIQLDVANLSNGMYYLYVHDGITPAPEVHKIIINH